MDDEISIGLLFEQLDEVNRVSLNAARKSTEFYEKEISGQLHDLSSVVADLLVLLREHLSCHDCEVVNHSHHPYHLVEGAGHVSQVFPGEMKGGVDASTEGTSTPQDSSSSDHGRT